MNQKRFPHTKVELIRQGEVKITFANGKNILHIESEILQPLINELDIERYLIKDDDISNIIANTFTNFPRNQKDQLQGFLTIYGDYIAPCKENSKENKYICDEEKNVEDLIIIGANGKEKLKTRVTDINSSLNIIISRIKSTIEFIKNTVITDDDVKEFNS